MKDVSLLGKKVHPIVKWDYYTDPDHLTGGAHHYVSGEERTRMVRSAANEHKKKLRKDFKEKDWYVEAIHSNGSFDLQSECGFTFSNVKRSDFRLKHS